MTVAANVSGGVVGKMISPQSIAVAAAAGHLVGRESELFRFTVKHSFIMLVFICFLVLGQAYLYSWIIPEYDMLAANAASGPPQLSKGYTYLFVLVAVILALAAFIFVTTRKKISDAEISTVTVKN